MDNFLRCACLTAGVACSPHVSPYKQPSFVPAPHLRAYSDVADHSHTAADLLLHRQPSSATSSGGRDSWARRHWSSLARRATEESHPTEENHSGGNAPSGRQVSPRRRRYTAPAGGGDVVLHAESQVPRAGTALAAVPETCNAVPPSVEVDYCRLLCGM